MIALAVGAAALAFYLVLRFAVSGALPAWAVAIAAPCALLALVAAVFRAGVLAGPLRLDERGRERPLLRRHGFGVIAIGTCLALPTLGSFSLIDPWETHYAEVAREMLERHDFVSPWWAHQGWFMTKPVLTFWFEALAMFALGVRTGPDGVLAHGAHPEWAVRLPSFLIALVGVYVLYHGVARTCGRRAGFLGALALWTMPGFALLAHQATTDMPLIGCVAASLGLLLRALDTPAGAQTATYTLRIGPRTMTLHAAHALAAFVALLTVPQLAAIALEHVHRTAAGLRIGPDHLVAGSPHACTLPGQLPCENVTLAHPGFPPALQVLIFLPIVVWLVVRIGSERRVAHLFALGAWAFASLAGMAKGPAGLVIPAAATLLVLASRRSLKPLLLLEIPTGIALAVAMIGPWYLAIWARHGRGFLDELVMSHMIGRTLGHLHDTNDGEDVGLTYFVRQLGYATFPWCGLLAAAALSPPLRDDGSRRSGARTLLFGAALFMFALVSAMRTKFHHYVLPAVPPFAMLLGIWLDERLSEAREPGKRRLVATAAISLGAACVLALVARDLAMGDVGSGASSSGASRLMKLFTYRYEREWPSANAFAPALIACGVLSALASIALMVRTWRRNAVLALSIASMACAALLLDGYLVRCASDGGQRGVIDAYYRARGSAAAPLVAYQLNWKGENFYTGNHLAIFVSSGTPMREWLDAQRRRGEHTFYFVTERHRVRSLRAELGSGYTFSDLTDASVSAEFALVRAESALARATR